MHGKLKRNTQLRPRKGAHSGKQVQRRRGAGPAMAFDRHRGALGRCGLRPRPGPRPGEPQRPELPPSDRLHVRSGRPPTVPGREHGALTLAQPAAHVRAGLRGECGRRATCRSDRSGFPVNGSGARPPPVPPTAGRSLPSGPSLSTAPTAMHFRSVTAHGGPWTTWRRAVRTKASRSTTGCRPKCLSDSTPAPHIPRRHERRRPSAEKNFPPRHTFRGKSIVCRHENAGNGDFDGSGPPPPRRTAECAAYACFGCDRN
jgi:hypothetical protein